MTLARRTVPAALVQKKSPSRGYRREGMDGRGTEVYPPDLKLETGQNHVEVGGRGLRGRYDWLPVSLVARNTVQQPFPFTPTWHARGQPHRRLCHRGRHCVFCDVLGIAATMAPFCDHRLLRWAHDFFYLFGRALYAFGAREEWLGMCGSRHPPGGVRDHDVSRSRYGGMDPGSNDHHSEVINS